MIAMVDTTDCSSDPCDGPSTFDALDSIGPLSAAIVQLLRSHRLLAGLLLRRFGLHPFQELVMLRLWEAGPQRQVDLAQYLGADKATITRSIQRLVVGGFVRCQPSPTDKRATIVEATTASRSLQKDVQEAWDHLETISGADLAPAEREQARDLLIRIQRSIDAAIDALRDEPDPTGGSEASTVGA
jgi:DNA-binding MarR family transcriptional regulator